MHRNSVGVIASAAVLAAGSLISCAPAHRETPATELPVWVSVADEEPPGAKDGAEKGPPSGAMKALEFWGDQRAYPKRQIPEADYGIAIQASRSMRAQSGAALEDGVAPWSPIGPANVGGRTLSLALDPIDPDILYAGSASGGLWKSTTGGVGADAWDPVDTGLPVLGVATIAVDPTDGDVIYIGTGEAYSYGGSNGGEVIRTTRGSYGVGILKTEDGGATWDHSLDWTYQQSRGVWMIRIDPTDTDIVYAATTEGVYKSIDAGASWTLVHNVIMAMDIRIHPDDPETLFAAHGNFGSTGYGIYRTIDGGQNWTKLTAGLPAIWTGKAQLAIAEVAPPFPPGAEKRIYASIANSGGQHGLYMSANRGGTWTQTTAQDYAAYQGWYSHYVVVSPFSPTVLFTGGIEIWKSTDGGESLDQRSSWQSVFFGISPPEGPLGGPDYAHADHHFALWHPTDPNTIFFASDGGVFRTTDLGETFESLIGGYQTSQFYNGFSNSPTDENFAIGGLQDNFTVIYGGTNAWSREIGGDGSWSAINPLDDSTVYGSAQNLYMVRSVDSGEIWTNVSPPIHAGDATAFVAPYVLSPSEPSVLYAGRSRVYRTDDEGDNWTATNGDAQLSDGNPVLSLAVADSTSDVAYAGTAPLTDRGRVFRTRDGGASWDDVTGTLPDRYFSDLAVDPSNPDRLFVTLMGFGSSHVFKSEDGGGSWIDIGGGLPDIPTSAVMLDPEYSDAIYVGTDLGIYFSLDGGDSWQTFQDGMPLAMVNDLKVQLSGRKIRAATHGNGAWEREMFGPGACGEPGEVIDLQLAQTGGSGGTTTLAWSAPVDTGPAPLSYDTVSSLDPANLDTDPSASCVESDGNDTTSVDLDDPDPGALFYYLIRAKSICGAGSVGEDSGGAPRVARDCPGA